jgi:hypothetical protein
MQGLAASAGKRPINDTNTTPPSQILLLKACLIMSPFWAHNFTLL